MNQTPVKTEQQLPDAQFRDDEINLFDLVRDLNVQKRWVMGPLIACFVLALLYVALAKPVFQVKSVVKAASEKDLVELNPPELRAQYIDGQKIGIDVFSMDVETAFEQSKQALLSREYRKAFYHENLEVIMENELFNEALTLEQNFDAFNGNFKIKLSNDKKDAEKFVELKLELGNPELATELLNDYVTYSLKSRLNDVKATYENKLEQSIRKLEYDAGLIRDKYFSDKTREKLELAEALSIAKSVGIKNPIHQKSSMIANNSGLPRYMYGENALKAEKRALDSRSKLAKGMPFGEEHFIEGLPEKNFEIKKLKELKLDFVKVQLAKVDELATLPRKPIKPKKALILALSLIAGGFLGLMTALLVAAYKRYLKDHEPI